MYPGNVYLFTPAVTLQTHCTCGPTRGVALKTSPQHHLTKQQSEAHQSSRHIFQTSRGISLTLRGHKSNSWIQNSKGDSKTMWSHVNKLFPKTKSSGIPSLEIDGRLITTPRDIANKFNTFFVSIGENLANLIAVPSRTALDWLRSSYEAVSDQFHFTPVTALEVQKLLEALNSEKATGLDDIQARLLKIGILQYQKACASYWIFH